MESTRLFTRPPKRRKGQAVIWVKGALSKEAKPDDKEGGGKLCPFLEKMGNKERPAPNQKKGKRPARWLGGKGKKMGYRGGEGAGP